MLQSNLDGRSAPKSNLAAKGLERIEWAAREMPVLRSISDRFAAERPLEGLRVVSCLHITTETANLARALKAGGADLSVVSCNPLTIQADVAAALTELGVTVFARAGIDAYYKNIRDALALRPHIAMDDGADMISTIHRELPELLAGIIGGTEETTTGVVRLRAMAADGALRIPVVAINDSKTKHLFDNRYGTGQSSIDGILRATNVLIAGKTAVVGGYGWCSRGIATRLRGMGANVIVTEVDPVCALEAAMDGFRVMPSVEAVKEADFVVVATGNLNVIDAHHYGLMKDGVVLANAGHFDAEISVPALKRAAVATRRIRQNIDEYLMPDGRRINLLCEGRLVNLVAAEGHPSAVMDLSFANQALGAELVARKRGQLAAGVHRLPDQCDRDLAQLKLASMDVAIDVLTEEQERYLNSWKVGT